jgi:hypothetical protein
LNLLILHRCDAGNTNPQERQMVNDPTADCQAEHHEIVASSWVSYGPDHIDDTVAPNAGGWSFSTGGYPWPNKADNDQQPRGRTGAAL